VREAQSVENYQAGAKQKAAAKLSRIPVKVEPAKILKKPEWIRVKAGSATTRFYEIKQILREHNLHTVCEEASCPNIGECFGKGTATFMIMGDKCTRRCPFCDVGHGRPDPLDVERAGEPGQDHRRAEAEVRGDHQRRPRRPARWRRRPFRRLHPPASANCRPQTTIEMLVPDFRGRDDRALEILKAAPPDVMNHNLETDPAPVQGSAARLRLPVQPEPA
jgi:lipoic acid synthetase